MLNVKDTQLVQFPSADSGDLECYVCSENQNSGCYNLKPFATVPTVRCAGACFWYYLSPPRAPQRMDSAPPIVRGCTFNVADRTKLTAEMKLSFDFDNFTKSEDKIRAKFCSTPKCNNYTYTDGSGAQQRSSIIIFLSLMLLSRYKFS